MKRFGPFVPKGALPRRCRRKEPPEEAASLPAKPAMTAPQLVAERAKLVGQVAPTAAGALEDKADADGDYRLRSPEAKPLVSDGLFEIQNDYQNVKGLSTALLGETFPPADRRPGERGSVLEVGGNSPRAGTGSG